MTTGKINTKQQCERYLALTRYDFRAQRCWREAKAQSENDSAWICGLHKGGETRAKAAAAKQDVERANDARLEEQVAALAEELTGCGVDSARMYYDHSFRPTSSIVITTSDMQHLLNLIKANR